MKHAPLLVDVLYLHNDRSMVIPMTVEILTIACLKDNYAFLVHNPQTAQTLLVDAPEAAPIEAALNERGWTLTDVFLTHHHWDHVNALTELQKNRTLHIHGAAQDAARLPALDHSYSEGPTLIIGLEAHIYDVPGHTVGHIALYLPQQTALFSADTLMAMGCGRLFEGTPSQMHASLQKLATLPSDTWVYSGHEYTHTNASFAQTLEPNNPDLRARLSDIHKKRAKDAPTVPSLLGDELKTNPFLRTHSAEIQKNIGLQNQSAEGVFAEIRRLKDAF